MKRSLLVAAALAVVASSPAYANVLALAGPDYTALVTLNSNGTVEYNGVAYTEVQQQDKLYSDFSKGNLPGTPAILFSFSNVDGQDHHTISFIDSLTTKGKTYTFSYDIDVVAGSLVHLQSADADVHQTAGVSTLTITLHDNTNSKTDTISFTTTGASPVGNTSVSFVPVTDSLEVTDSLAISAAHGSNATGVLNSFVQTAIPEPTTWAMMALGFAGLGWAARRSPKARVAAA